MSYGRTVLKGAIYHDSRKSYNGFTLINPIGKSFPYLIDMHGKVINHWNIGGPLSSDARLLPNGNLLCTLRNDDGPMADLEGSGGILLEIDWHGNIVWKYEDPFLHHGFYRRDNGNTLVLKWVQMPPALAAKVKGGVSGSERNGVMWGDAIQEITPGGEIVWEWVAHEHLKPESLDRCLLCPRDTWIHANGISEMIDGSIVVSFAKINTVAIIDKRSSNIKWQWGSDTLSHQSSPVVLDGGDLLVFDNGMHPYGFAFSFSRVVEISVNTSSISWIYGGADDTTIFYSSIMGSCQRLANGNTLVCEGTSGRVFEVNANGDLVWEFVNNYEGNEKPHPGQSRTHMICSAFRYGPEYSGLKDPSPMCVDKEPAPTYESRDEEIATARLWGLGY